MKTVVLIFTLFFSCLIQNSFGATLPDIPLTTNKQSINLKNLKGQVVYVDFWASWCGPCRKSFPWLNKMHRKYSPQGLKIIAINVDEDRSLAEAFLKEYGADFTIGYDARGELATAMKVQGMPSSFLVDRNGVIRHSHVGFREKEIQQMENQIQKLIRE